MLTVVIECVELFSQCIADRSHLSIFVAPLFNCILHAVQLHEEISHAISQIQSSQLVQCFSHYTLLNVYLIALQSIGPRLYKDMVLIQLNIWRASLGSGVFLFLKNFSFTELLQWIILVQINRKHCITFLCLFSVKKGGKCLSLLICTVCVLSLLILPIYIKTNMPTY